MRRGAQGPTPRRLALAARAAELRRENKTTTQIAVALGLSRSYAAELLDDPEGRKGRARKDSYSLPCPLCGAAMSGSGGPAHPPEVCAACEVRLRSERKTWTRDRIIRAFREFAAAAGRSPTVLDANPALLKAQAHLLSDERLEDARRVADLRLVLPLPNTVYGEFGSWRDAVLAADLEPAHSGQRAHRARRRLANPARERVLQVLWSGGRMTSAEIAAAAGISRERVREQLRALRREGIVRSELAQSGMPGSTYLYWITEKEAEAMPRFVVLTPTGDPGASRDSFVEVATVDAPTREIAVERGANEQGTFKCVPAQYWDDFEVRPVERLSVVRPAAKTGS